MLNQRLTIIMMVLLCLTLSAAMAPNPSLRYEKQDTWAETMLVARASWLSEQAEVTFKPFISEVLRGGDAPVRVEMDLRGVDTLRLIATIGPDTYSYDQAIWGNATLTDAAGKTVRLSALKPKSVSVGYGKLESDHNHTGAALRVAGQSFEHGLWAHAPSELVYELNDAYVRFEAWVGIDAGAGKNGSAVFKVLNAKVSLEMLWERIKADFPLQCAYFTQDTQNNPLIWFSRDTSLKAEQRLLKTAFDALGARRKDLQRNYAQLQKNSPAAQDLAWLRLYDAVAEERELTRRLAQELDQVNLPALRLAIEDLMHAFPEQYARGAGYLKELGTTAEDWESLKVAVLEGDNDAAQRAGKVLAIRREALLANPLIDFNRLLAVRRNEKAPSLGLPCNWQGNCSLPKGRYDNDIILLEMEPYGAITSLYKPHENDFLGDVDLHFDADKFIFSMAGSHGLSQIWELAFTEDPLATDLPAYALRQVTLGKDGDVDNYDACYLPDGRIIYASTACYTGIPCVFGGDSVANLCIMDADGANIRQLCFDQDHNWCPTVMPNGRVLYQRWEYTDTPHSNTRLLFSMNPDGTSQMEYYGSNSYWPNSFFYARPVPNHPTKVVGIATGHHGVRRMGEMVILDPALSRREAKGAVQRISDHGEKVEAIYRDQLVDDSWPKFLHPYPLSEKYFLVSAKLNKDANWGIYLVDIFDNMLLIKETPGYVLFEPVPLRKTPKPPVIPDRVNLAKKEAGIYLEDIYQGEGLRGVPRGTVKELRVYTYQYAYRKMGGLMGMVGMDGPWDVRRILGKVPVEEDGSAFFEVPANTPIAIQPLDEEGKAIQQMRSWFTAMPGEVLSCVGCHEQQNSSPPAKQSIAALRAPSKIQHWYGPPRGFSFAREVQPVLDAYCVDCHGEKRDKKTTPDLRGTKNITDWTSKISGRADPKNGGKFSVAYAELHRYVRRAGIESDYHILTPMEYHADTTELVQMLQNGHHAVELNAEAWDRLITWIDFNAPYHGSWTDMMGDDYVAHHADRCNTLRKEYAGIDLNYEIYPDLPVPTFNKSVSTVTANATVSPKLADWPFSEKSARERQAEQSHAHQVDLGDGMDLSLVKIPAGDFVMGGYNGHVEEKPRTAVSIDADYWISRFEISNAQYAQFDPEHDSRVETKHGYQFGVHGYPLNNPEQPVVRVSWEQAMAFCDWLSEKTGKTFTLPTEAQWEYACRAGSDTPFFFGDLDSNYSQYANVADKSLPEFVSDPYKVFAPLKDLNRYDDWIPRDDRYNDGAFLPADVTGYKPNAWGVHNMHGNVWEWTRSALQPYPYDAGDGRNARSDTGNKRVVRGGSWYDRPKRATASVRLGYQPWQRIFNVGFRVVCLDE